jgi:hypothetical protein
MGITESKICWIVEAISGVFLVVFCRFKPKKHTTVFQIFYPKIALMLV